ncbi:OmpA family protein [Flavobacterium sp. 14A]|uniref:OmpA family protein n=1 Tax=Flavobacterium sp. 14A TaxID=2735896 RepID=UPI00156EB3FA|nr:OmpA family protein [Flavobacterium sp. 14A]NRT11585.1 outer membrane protein OmpA-like peptidoglycan-associated protein [Flavobacterium sp. 14A]
MKKNTLIILLLFVVLGHAQDANYTIKNIEDNSKYSDFGPTYYGDNQVIYASSRKVKGKRNKTWYKNSQPFLELYKATVDSTGEFVESNLFSKNLNTKYHESNVAFTNDEKTIYFSSDNYTDKKRHTDKDGWVLIQLYKATVDSTGTWVDVKKLPFNSDEFDTGHPSLNADNSILYFTSNRPGSYGLTDIWAVDVLGEDSYGEPYNLGPNVNSTRSEMFPYIDTDNVLYYSSDGKNYGNGGLDLYAVKIKDRLGMNEAVNLGLPLNSLKDDFSMVFQKGKKTGHFSSNRDGGKGDDDIYYFEELVNPIIENCKQLVQGVVREKETGALLPGALVTLYNAKGEKVESVIADKFASFAFNVDCEAGYRVTGAKEFYDMDEESFTTSNVADLALSIGLDLGSNEFVFVRDKLMIKINPIYFDLDRSFIRPDAALELERVLTIMQKYPLIKISLGSHTDSRAADAYNWALSNRRAKSSKDWLVKAGIDPSRLTARGYGETELVNTCSNGVSCSEFDHQLNRRTEFVITNPEVIK